MTEVITKKLPSFHFYSSKPSRALSITFLNLVINMSRKILGGIQLYSCTCTVVCKTNKWGMMSLPAINVGLVSTTVSLDKSFALTVWSKCYICI